MIDETIYRRIEGRVGFARSAADYLAVLDGPRRQMVRHQITPRAMTTVTATTSGPAVIRDDSRDGPTEEAPDVRIAGHAAVFYDGTQRTEYRIGDDMVERVMPGAFDRAIEEGHDVRGVFNHDKNLILGRTASGTMTLTVNPTGLLYNINPPDTQSARDVVTLIERGDVSGSSFKFTIRSEDMKQEDGVHVFEIRDVDLFDVGPVTFPAYDSTDVEIAEAKRCAEFLSNNKAAFYDPEVLRRELRISGLTTFGLSY